MIQENTYHYHRSKDILTEDGKETLIVMACLNIDRERREETTSRTKLIEGPAVKIETNIDSADSDLLSLPDGDIFIELTEAEFNLLAEISETDEKSFLLYRHVFSNCRK
ncbi:hypothetical protein [Viridibacillus arvi]|uniref:hypothetical protein n=1 Tax=Viridibacillus arvi TaxID=263475 RepID=UPI0034CDAF39